MKITILIVAIAIIAALIGYSVLHNNPLQERAKKFLEMPIPEGMEYVPDSFAERFIVEYAQNGKVELDPELGEILQITVMELPIVEGAKPGTEEAFMNESAGILREILSENSR